MTHDHKETFCIMRMDPAITQMLPDIKRFFEEEASMGAIAAMRELLTAFHEENLAGKEIVIRVEIRPQT